jgi:hypothetical protein
MLEQYIRRLGNSRPIFRLQMREGSSRIDRVLVNKYVPTVIPGDAVSTIVRKNYQESFGSGRFKTSERDMIRSCVDDVKRVLRNFIDQYGGYKNARQSSIYRFMCLSSYSITDEHIDGLIMLYQYGCTLGLTESGKIGGGNDKHIVNILSIIELMRTKYEEN